MENGNNNEMNDDYRLFDFGYDRKIVSHPRIMDRYHCVVCHSGWTHGSVNLHEFRLSKGCVAINIPGQILQHHEMSQDFTASVISFSSNFMISLGFPYNFQINKIIMENPVLYLNDSEYEGILRYCEMATRILSRINIFKSEMIRHLTCVAIYGLSHCVTSLPHKPPTAEESLMKRFMYELETNFKTTRRAQEYAKKLNVTHPYLASVVKKVSNRTISDWIADYIILEAKALLNSSPMTIQQISSSLNFPSQSFFGKFFKKHTGMSPKSYRDSLT